MSSSPLEGSQLLRSMWADFQKGRRHHSWRGRNRRSARPRSGSPTGRHHPWRGRNPTMYFCPSGRSLVVITPGGVAATPPSYRPRPPACRHHPWRGRNRLSFSQDVPFLIPCRHHPWRGRNHSRDRQRPVLSRVVITPGRVATPGRDRSAAPATSSSSPLEGSQRGHREGVERPGRQSSSPLEGSQPGECVVGLARCTGRHHPWRGRNQTGRAFPQPTIITSSSTWRGHD